MSTTPALTPKELIRLLIERGFVFDRQKGSHAIYKLPDGTKRVVVPMHNRDLPKGTFHSILKQAGIHKEEI